MTLYCLHHLDTDKAILPPVYDAVLSSSKGVQDIAYNLNKLFEKHKNKDWICINTSVEATTVRNREPNLLKQDKFIRDHISEEDVLIVSIGGNDIALSPSTETQLSMTSLLKSSIKKIETGKAEGLDHFIVLFKNRVENYIKNLVEKIKPPLIIVNTVYYPYEGTDQSSWASKTLKQLGYNSNPKFLQTLVTQIYKRATSKIKIPGVKVVAVPLYDVLDSEDIRDYDNRVEPSIQGGKKMAKEYYKIIKTELM
jgi:hypothetical protein